MLKKNQKWYINIRINNLMFIRKIMNFNGKERLKTFMFNNKLSIPDISNKTGLNVNTIKNVLYGRSNKKEYFSQIALSFNISEDYFFEENVLNYETQIFKTTVETIVGCLLEKKIQTCPKNFLDYLILECYKLLISRNYNKKDLLIYIKGHLDSALNQKIIQADLNI